MQISYKPYTPALATQGFSKPRLFFGNSSKQPAEKASKKLKLSYYIALVTTLSALASVFMLAKQKPVQTVSAPPSSPTATAEEGSTLANQFYGGMPILKYVQTNIKKTKTEDPTLVAEEDLCKYFKVESKDIKTVMSFIATLMKLESKPNHIANVIMLLRLIDTTEPLPGKDKEFAALSYIQSDGTATPEQTQQLINWILQNSKTPEMRTAALRAASGSIMTDQIFLRIEQEKQKQAIDSKARNT